MRLIPAPDTQRSLQRALDRSWYKVALAQGRALGYNLSIFESTKRIMALEGEK